MSTLAAARLDSFCTSDELVQKLQAYVKQMYRFQSTAARAWGCSPAFVNAVLHARREPPPFMLSHIGYERVKGYAFTPSKRAPILLDDDQSGLLEPLAKPIKILWALGDEDERLTATEGLRATLRIRIRDHYRSRTPAAAAWGCSQGLVSRVLSGEKMPTDAMLDELGLEKISGFRKTKEAASLASSAT